MTFVPFVPFVPTAPSYLPFPRSASSLPSAPFPFPFPTLSSLFAPSPSISSTPHLTIAHPTTASKTSTAQIKYPPKYWFPTPVAKREVKRAGAMVRMPHTRVRATALRVPRLAVECLGEGEEEEEGGEGVAELRRSWTQA